MGAAVSTTIIRLIECCVLVWLSYRLKTAAAARLGRREVVGGDDLGLAEVDEERAASPAVEADALALGGDEAALLLALGDEATERLQVHHLALVVDALAVRAEGVVGALEVDGEVPVLEHVVDLVLEVSLHGHHAEHAGSFPA